MYFITKEEDLIGKEIVFTHMAEFADAITIVTKDGGIFVVSQDEETISIYRPHLAEDHIMDSSWIRKELHDKGIITEDQINEFKRKKEEAREKHHREWLKAQEEQERKTYERLKAKFENQ